MGTIARPTKPTGGGGGASWVAGADLLANELNEDIDPVYTDYNGNVSNVNVAASAAIEGTKIAAAPAGIPTDRINALAVTEVKLAALAVAIAKLKKTTYSHAPVINVVAYSPPASQGVTNVDTGLAVATTLPIAVYIVTAGIPGYPMAFHLAQTGGTWRVVIHSAHTTGFAIGANELKVEYLT